MNKVWVQLGENGLASKIFSHYKEMILKRPVDAKAIEMERALAVRQIRVQIWDRQDGTCLNCPALLTWGSLHLHERIHRGKGGNISLDNSVGLCYTCHITVAHGNRRPRFGENKRKI